MGGCASLPGGGGQGGLLGATERAERRLGRLAVGGRYHRLPRRVRDDYVLENVVLGSGCSGQVVLARSRHKDSSARRYAAKRFLLAGVSRERREEVAVEVEIFLGMDHPHVARLADAYETETCLVLVMECMTGGELLRRTQEKRFSDREAGDAVYQMLLALNYLHSHGVVHRDIKLENFMYEEPGSNSLKLVDFGLSNFFEPDTELGLSCGTLAYMAPEVLLKRYTSKCDLWSLGVASFVLVFGYMPFSGSDKRQVQSIKAAKFEVRRQAFRAAAPDAKAFVQALLVADPDLRPSAEQALAHPWMVAARRGAATAPLARGVVDALHDFGQASAFHRAVLMMVAWSLTSEERGRVSEEFLKMDPSNCGAVKPSEFGRLLQEQFQITGARAEEMFEALDVLGAGEIRYSTFLAAAAPSQIGLRENLVRATFRRFDVDATGTVTHDNLRTVLGESFGGQEVGGMLEEVHTSQPGQISRDEFVAHFCSKGRGAATGEGLVRAAAMV